MGSPQFDPDHIDTEEECPFPGHDAFEEKQAKKTRLRNQVSRLPQPSDLLIWYQRNLQTSDLELVIFSFFCFGLKLR